jgi:hypothetical protein
MSAADHPTRISLNLAPVQSHFCWDDPEINDFINEILDAAPEEWDDDVSANAIAIDFVNHLVSEVKRRGGCLKKFCWDDEPGEWDGPCDHGYDRT